MLPILNSLEVTEIIPISESATRRFQFYAGINAMVAENAKGKTTLCDIIERSICSDAHAQRYSAFARKRKTKEAYIKSSWLMDNEVQIHQALTDAGIRTTVIDRGGGKKTLTKQEYSNFFSRKLHLTLNEFQELFQSLYYKREDDFSLLGRTEETDPQLLAFFKLLNKFTSGSPDDIRLRQEINQKKIEKKDLQDKLRKIEEEENKIRTVMNTIGISDVSEAILDAKYDDLSRKITEKKKELENIEKVKSQIEEEIDKETDELYNVKDEHFLNAVKELEKIKSELSLKKKERVQVQREIAAASKVGNEKYDYLKEKVSKKPKCEFCGTNLAEEWNNRLQIGCPLCGTEWAKLSRELREGLFAEPEKPDTASLELKLEEIDLEIKQIENEIRKKEVEVNEVKSAERKIQNKIIELKTKLKMREKEIKSLTQTIHSLTNQRTSIKTEKEFLTTKVNLQELLRKKLDVQKRIDEKQDELEELLKLQNVSHERNQILENFQQATLEIFGYGILVNPKEMSITLMVDHSTRAYESLSGGEKYFIDICLRIAVWKYLLKNGFTRQGMLIIDSPENSLDNERLGLLTEVLNSEKENFLFIVTTRNQEFYEKLDAQIIDSGKFVQTSLFDFIK